MNRTKPYGAAVPKPLVYAYDLRDPKLSNRQRLIPGGEKWMFWEWLNVQAKMSDENIAALSRLSPGEQEVYKRRLLQSMLEERFKLKVHHVTRDAPAWALVVAKNGPKNMKRVADTAEGIPAFPDFNHARFTAAPMAALIDQANTTSTLRSHAIPRPRCRPDIACHQPTTPSLRFSLPFRISLD
jgi:uncharacterized protein (TIGR03435 family)